MSMLQTFFDDSCKYQHFVSYPQKSEFQIRHPYKGAESTGCLVQPDMYRLHTYLAIFTEDHRSLLDQFISQVSFQKNSTDAHLSNQKPII